MGSNGILKIFRDHSWINSLKTPILTPVLLCWMCKLSAPSHWPNSILSLGEGKNSSAS